MATIESNSKRLAKNTAFMYIRMAVLMCISLYTSRIVLKELGVDDFGIYNLVGSIVAMFSSVRVLFSSSTQRFLTYEMGRDNYDKLSDIFNTSVYINIIISILFIVGVECLGLWFLNNEINIDPSRFFAAQIVFQLSLLSAVMSIFTTSYDAVIVAHEKMNFYAYLSIVEGVMRLAIVFLLQLFTVDKLIMYGSLTCFVSIIVLLVNYSYCKMNFIESSFTRKFSNEYFKDMTRFAGWNFFGVTAFTLTQNGLNMVLNVFGGAVVNAARGLTYQVTGVLNNFMDNIAIVLYPYGIKLYSSGKIESFLNLFYFSSKILFFLQSCIVITITLFLHEILSVWLGKVPMYTEVFLKLVLINTLVRSLHSPLDLIFKAVGKLKYYQMFEGFILFLPLVISYFFLKSGEPYYMVFVSIIIFEVINLLVILMLARKYGSVSIRDYLIRVIFPSLIMFCLGVLAYNFAIKESVLLRFIVLVITIIFMLVSFAFTLNNFEREQIIRLLFNRK